jgi:sterol desaturase/sphingolipid hydroxylase (fatty acid hydroxylase superfamily)
VFGFADTISNLTAGFGEVLIGLLLGPLLIALYDFGYEHFALVHWPEHSALPWLLAFVVSDLCYYWYHRAGHRVAALWAIHGVHHQSEHFNVSVAMRHPWLSDSYSALFYVPLPLLGIPPTHFFVAISVISFYALTIHTRFFNRPALYIFTTPATHVLHHATNPEYIGKNLGAMFNVWDRLFGTYVALDPQVTPVLGTRSGYETHDGVLSQWVLARRIFGTARRARSWSERFAAFWRHPGWLPQGLVLPAAPRPRAESVIPLRVRYYVAAQFALLTIIGLRLLWLRDREPPAALALGIATVLFGLWTLGGLLDARRHAMRWEATRLAVTAAWLWCWLR